MIRRRIAKLAPWLLLAGLLAPGCIVIDGDADLTFFWDFEGADCWEAGVSETFVGIYDGLYEIAHEHVPCGFDGVTLEGFDPGRYGFRISGFAPSGALLYDVSGNIDARRGRNEYDVRLYWAGW